MRCQFLLITVLIPLVLSACGEPADTRSGQPVTHRRTAFKKILRAFEPMGIQLRNKRYDAKQFIDQARELASLKNDPWHYFGDDTNYPPTRAKATVWSEPGQFETARQAFLQATDRLVMAAESRDEKNVTTAYETVHDSCRNCHKAFRD
jgi:cytochrome c556